MDNGNDDRDDLPAFRSGRVRIIGAEPAAPTDDADDAEDADDADDQAVGAGVAGDGLDGGASAGGSGSPSGSGSSSSSSEAGGEHSAIDGPGTRGAAAGSSAGAGAAGDVWPSATDAGGRADPEMPWPTAEPELPHWTEAPTGEVPAVLSRTDDSPDAADPWSAAPPPTWREEHSDWSAQEESFEPSMLAHEEGRLGSLGDPTTTDDRTPWAFDLPDAERLGDPEGSDARASEDVGDFGAGTGVVDGGVGVGGAAGAGGGAGGSAETATAGTGVDATTGAGAGEAGATADGGVWVDEPTASVPVVGGTGSPGAGVAASASRSPSGGEPPAPSFGGGSFDPFADDDAPSSAVAFQDEPGLEDEPGLVDVPAGEAPGGSDPVAGGYRGGDVGGLSDHEEPSDHDQLRRRGARAAGAGAATLRSGLSRAGRAARHLSERGDAETASKAGAAASVETASGAAALEGVASGNVPDDGPYDDVAAYPRRRARPVREPVDVDAPDQSGGTDRNLPVAVATGVVVGIIALICFAAGTAPALVLATIVVVLATAEGFAAFRRAGYHPATLLGLVAVIALMIATYNRGLEAPPLIAVLVVACSLVWYLAGVEPGADPVPGAAVTVFTFVWVGVFGSYAALLLNPNLFPDRHGIAFLLGAIIATVAYDVGALGVGSWIGQRKLSPSISPNKTWEGLIGGAVSAILVSLIVVHFIHPWSVGGALLLGIVVAVVCPIGDMCESLVKRHLNLKDMGRLLPGHGGVLDRVDGLLFVLPATYYLVKALHLG